VSTRPVTVAVLARDLMIATRIGDAGGRAGVEVGRFDHPDQLPAAASVRLLLVDWDARGPDWGERLKKWCVNAPVSVRPRVVLFGPHTDLAAHADAHAAGLGPMLARSKLLADLPTLFA
jgi:hypothetical protein